MHRVRAIEPAERRLERLAFPGTDDNRISGGCINIPIRFYENVMQPAFAAGRGTVYVMPEARALTEVFSIFHGARYESAPAATCVQPARLQAANLKGFCRLLLHYKGRQSILTGSEALRRQLCRSTRNKLEVVLAYIQGVTHAHHCLVTWCSDQRRPAANAIRRFLSA